LALPFFLALPVFDPWATNPMYGYDGEGQTAIRYLYPDTNLAALSAIATRARWATGSCLPSLHVAFPLIFALIAAKHRLRVDALVLGAIAVGTGVAVVYLGRHWIMDVILAIPFAFAVRWVVQRVDPLLILPWETTAKRAE
jgi:membrane-associated phospholipid phosphatase